MKFMKKIMFCILIFFLILTSFVFASNNSDTNNKEMIKVFNTDLYLGGQDVVISDAVNGNVFTFGSTVTVKGEILGDIFILAKSLTIDEAAIIHGNIFAFSNDMTMKGKVSYDIYFLGQDFELADTAYANRDIRAFVANAKLYGSIKKDAFLFVDSILMKDNAENVIGGSLHYTSDKEFTFPEKAVMGNVKYTQYQEHTRTAGEIAAKYIKQFISDLSLTIVIILLAVFLAPKLIDKVNYALMKRPFISSGIGILSFVLIPVLSLFLLFTGLFSGLAFATFVVYGSVLIMSLAIFSLAIAKSLATKWNITSKGKFILIAILSAIVLWLAQSLPYLGGYVSIFLFVVGLGVFFTSFMKIKEKN